MKRCNTHLYCMLMCLSVLKERCARRGIIQSIFTSLVPLTHVGNHEIDILTSFVTITKKFPQTVKAKHVLPCVYSEECNPLFNQVNDFKMLDTSKYTQSWNRYTG